MSRKIFLLAALLFLFLAHGNAQDKNDPVILSLSGENIPKSEFMRVFKKNNNKDSGYEKAAVEEYLQLYINYKLKVREALELGMDTATSFREELAGYRKQLAQPYLVDKEVSESLIREAYNRMKTDLRASHILIKCDVTALPKDTLEAWNKAIKVRNELLKGGDFAAVAKKYSEDPSAKDNGGDLGYFSALQMVYTFESAAYSLNKGDISMPVRTRFGYHIIKLTDSRAAQGEVRVAHIMVKAGAGTSADDSVKAVQKINEIHAKLMAGEKFEDLARQFSDDQGSAKNGGALPMFGTGRMVPEFEKVAFSLQRPEEFSAPVKTSYGWHIIKLLEKKPLGTFEELQADLKQRIQKDSRSEMGKTSMINKIKSKYGFKENLKAREEFISKVDSSVLDGRWTPEKVSALNSNLISLGTVNYTQQDFAEYVNDHQSKKPQNVSPRALVSNMYTDWVNETCLAHEEARLDSLYPDFKNLMQEYRDGILLFELTDRKVWSKAVKDTSGLRDFYNNHKNNYMWGDRLEATIYTCANAAIAKEVRKLMKKIDDADTLMARVNKNSQLNLQVKYGKFSKGDNDIIDKIEWKTGITSDMPHNNQVVFVDVRKVMPAQPKSLEEAKGLVTADYQNALEKEWIAELKNRYSVQIHQDVVDSISKR